MNATISMDGLWSVIDSLSLKNKKWLADKLQVALSKPETSEEKTILSGIVRSVEEAKAGETYSLDTLWNQL